MAAITSAHNIIYAYNNSKVFINSAENVAYGYDNSSIRAMHSSNFIQASNKCIIETSDIFISEDDKSPLYIAMFDQSFISVLPTNVKLLMHDKSVAVIYKPLKSIDAYDNALIMLDKYDGVSEEDIMNSIKKHGSCVKIENTIKTIESLKEELIKMGYEFIDDDHLYMYMTYNAKSSKEVAYIIDQAKKDDDAVVSLDIDSAEAYLTEDEAVINSNKPSELTVILKFVCDIHNIKTMINPRAFLLIDGSFIKIVNADPYTNTSIGLHFKGIGCADLIQHSVVKNYDGRI